MCLWCPTSVQLLSSHRTSDQHILSFLSARLHPDRISSLTASQPANPMINRVKQLKHMEYKNKFACISLPYKAAGI